VEHRLVGAWVIDLTSSTDRLRSGTRERDAWALGTLLGPEGPGVAQPSGLDAAHRRDELRTIHAVEPPAECGKAGDHGSGPARTLRTAQWTRASLWPS